MRSRRACAVAWGVLVALLVIAWFARDEGALMVLWLLALPMIFASARSTRGAHDERLAHPRVYRAVAALASAVPFGGALLAVVPGHSAATTVIAAYCAFAAFLSYRSLVGPGPRRALALVTATQLLALPFIFLAAILSMGCKHPHVVVHPWTETASLGTFLVTQLVAMILAGIAPIAFEPRDEQLPEARLAR